jgi:hypothetical protein
VKATVYPLFPTAASEQTVAVHPLVAELSAKALQILDEQLRQMFDSADDMLFELSERAPNDADRRNYFDTMRVVRLDRARIAKTFSQRVEAGFRPETRSRPILDEAFDLDSLSIQPTEELEEKIALTNMSAKAEGLHRSVLWDLEQRLQALAGEYAVPISPQALNPAQLCAAFGAATAVLDADFRIKLVIYKLFDRMVVRELGAVFQAALEVLDRHGIRSGRRIVPAETPAPSPPPSSWPQPAPSVPVPTVGFAEPAPRASQQPTLDLLRRHGLDPDGLMASGDPVAQELGASLQTLLGLPSLSAVQASTQRLSMASRLFDDLLAEPLLPEALRPALEGLRYPAYRAALTDARFLTDAGHPLRRTISELIDLVLAAQTGDVAPARFNESLQQLQGQTPVGGGFGFTTLAGARQLPAAEVERFASQLREQSRSLRESLLLKVRKQVARELDLHTGPRQVPPPVQNLLRSGVGPLMAVRMLRTGRGSAPFQQAEQLLDRILGSLEFAPPPKPVELADRERLTNDIAGAFSDIGMAADKIEILLNGLQEVYAALDLPSSDSVAGTESASGLTAAEQQLLTADFGSELVAAPPAVNGPQAPTHEESVDDLPKVTAMELLSRVLTPESWFRVYDAAHEQTRWLKLSSFYAQQDSVTFSGFDEANRLVLHASRFADDLAAGHSEPVNPTASARQALEQLRHARAHGLL